jgi:NADPH:quinone reductase-like Zn-dependent oxidoreductase
VLKPGGKAVSISGPPDPAFADKLGLNPFLKLVMRLLSRAVRSKAKKRGVDYGFLFMSANGEQLGHIAKLIEAGAIRPVLDRVFPFAAANEALAYVETGRAKGKVVIKVK